MTGSALPPRALVVLRGEAHETLPLAHRAVAAFEDDLLVVSDAKEVWPEPQCPDEDVESDLGSLAPSMRTPKTVGHPRLRRLLGESFGAVVLDLHEAMHPESIGRAHGFVRAGGALVLRMPSELPSRFGQHIERALTRASLTPCDAVADHRVPTLGTEDQARAARALAEALTEAGSRVCLTADRGRGKSSALGLAVRATPNKQVVVTGPSEESAAEVMRFAGRPLTFVPADELLDGAEVDAILVDEAAQLPVAMLKSLVLQNPEATVAFSTTVHGYEGTGRGFALRFLPWLRERGPLRELHLDQAIRFAAFDPVERFVWDALLLDAEPPPYVSNTKMRAVHLGRAELGERHLREVFGLLVQAHYRTSPRDLEQMLDAPDLSTHGVLSGEHIVAANLVAQERPLSKEEADDVYWGRLRLRGMALSETFVSHLCDREAGALRMLRSVRIATHPSARLGGIARKLVEHVHASYEADIFGTLFGATDELVAFRQRLGYVPIRLGASRGARTGEPSISMARPVSEAGHQAVARARQRFAQNFELAITLMNADQRLPLSQALIDRLRASLPAATPIPEAQRKRDVEAYCFGPRTLEAVCASLRPVIADASVQLSTSLGGMALLERLVEERGWHTIASTHGVTVPTVMRAARRELRAWALNHGYEPPTGTSA